jgi:hypothetical protein
MPAGDRTGPMGWGPMTGRAAGYCAGATVPGAATALGGRGFGGGFGRGFGGGFWGGGRGRGGGRNRWRWYSPGLAGWLPAAGRGAGRFGYWASGTGYAPPVVPGLTREQQIATLKSQAQYLEDALAGVRKQLEDFQATAAGAEAAGGNP